MWPKSWIEGKADVLHALEDWRGAHAQAWGYSVSHSQFLLRLYRQTDSAPLGSLYLYLKICDRVAFLSLWRDAHIRIEERKGEYGPVFVVSDGDRLRIECGAVFAASSTELVSFESPSI